MVRAPCCEKMGLKRGPWTREEDQVLIDYVTHYGHGNWRALPKQAGLLRCGKSCRLRWTNYLRPDIKRGNFSIQEEDTIINLHALLGNRWSAIAARLPGRTDNEIKNVWHTHLKKRLNPATAQSKQTPTKIPKSKQTNMNTDEEEERESKANSTSQDFSEHSASSTSSTTSSVVSDITCVEGEEFITDYIPDLDDNFWAEVFSTNSDTETNNNIFQCQSIPVLDGNVHDHGMDFWYDVFTRSGELPKLSEFLLQDRSDI